MGVVEFIIQRNALAACRILLNIRGQRKHLKFRIPCDIRPTDPAILRNCAVREGNIKTLIGLVSPRIAKTEQFADRPVISPVSGIASGKAADRSGEAKRIGRTRIDTHLVSTDTHFDRVHGWIVTKVGICCSFYGLAVATKERAAIIKLHSLRIIIQARQNRSPQNTPALPLPVAGKASLARR